MRKSELLEGLDDNKAVVLYPSQPLYTGEEEMRKKLARDFLKLCKAFPDVQFLLKPHPGESDYESFFNDLSAEVQTDNFRFVNIDLYQTLAAVDIVLIYNSTVGAEACYFDKPVLVMDYSNNDFSGFIAAEVGVPAYNYNELHELLNRLLAGEQMIDPEKRKIFVNQRAHSIDGKTVERIVSKWEDM
jgi:CDP-glycerol glycerophosphotransferase (TagB/SpsB family)